MLIVGSKSLLHHFKNIERVPKDIDIIGTKEDVSMLTNILKPERVRVGDGIISLINILNKTNIFDTSNIEILLSDESEALSDYISYDKENGNGSIYASLEVLYSLKRSHIHFPVHFKKHISDYYRLNKIFNGIDKLGHITKKNYIETENRIGRLKTPRLNKSVSKFFEQSNSFVKYYFVHDDIHRMMAHKENPMYSYMQEDESSAKCEKYLWDRFTFEDKCKCVLEEAYVIALERKVLPSIFGGLKWISSKDAIDWSLMRICTTLCSGWFRQFATDNYIDIYNMINKNYVEYFLSKYNDGLINKIN